MKNVETRRKLNNLKKALLVAGFATTITACSKGENKERPNLNYTSYTLEYDYEKLKPFVSLGYILEHDVNGNPVATLKTNEYIYYYALPTIIVYEGENGKKWTSYLLPEGYSLVKDIDEDGKSYYIGVKTEKVVEPEKQKIR